MSMVASRIFKWKSWIWCWGVSSSSSSCIWNKSNEYGVEKYLYVYEMKVMSMVLRGIFIFIFMNMKCRSWVWCWEVSSCIWNGSHEYGVEGYLHLHLHRHVYEMKVLNMVLRSIFMCMKWKSWVCCWEVSSCIWYESHEYGVEKYLHIYHDEDYEMQVMNMV